MPSNVIRRPWPALVALVALLLLTALVWWRVLHRNDSGNTPQAGAGSTCTPSVSPSPTPSGAAASAAGASGSHSSRAAATRLPAPSAVTVRVLNATLRQGLAGKVQAALIKDGFASPQQPTNDMKHRNKIKTSAQIRYGSKGKSGAMLLQYYVPGARLVRTHSKHATVTLSLGDKFRHVASPRQVRAAMAAAAVTASSPTPSSSAPAPC